ncbi:MAG: hypothetical protein KC561_08390, partial [Myxococcales bacterium]|nr:hypothetical protein [Myxococcales bacterium]
MSDDFSWTEVLRTPPSDLIWLHGVGHPNAPDDPFGAEWLSLTPEGKVKLEWEQRGERAVWTARVPQALVQTLLDATADAGFPDIPLEMLVAGPGGHRTLTVSLGDRKAGATVGSHLEKQPAFGLIARIADSLCAQIRGRQVYGDDPAAGAISDVAEVKPSPPVAAVPKVSPPSQADGGAMDPIENAFARASKALTSLASNPVLAIAWKNASGREFANDSEGHRRIKDAVAGIVSARGLGGANDDDLRSLASLVRPALSRVLENFRNKDFPAVMAEAAKSGIPTDGLTAPALAPIRPPSLYPELAFDPSNWVIVPDASADAETVLNLLGTLWASVGAIEGLPLSWTEPPRFPKGPSNALAMKDNPIAERAWFSALQEMSKEAPGFVSLYKQYVEEFQPGQPTKTS